MSRVVPPPPPPPPALTVGLYNKLFYFQSCVHESIVVSVFRPACIAHTVAILFHGDWAIYDPHPTPLVYAIHNTILAIPISCKGQFDGRP